HRMSMAIRDTLSTQPAAQRTDASTRKPPSSDDGPDFASFMGSQDETQAASPTPKAPAPAGKTTKAVATKPADSNDENRDAAPASDKKTDAADAAVVQPTPVPAATPTAPAPLLFNAPSQDPADAQKTDPASIDPNATAAAQTIAPAAAI